MPSLYLLTVIAGVLLFVIGIIIAIRPLLEMCLKGISVCVFLVRNFWDNRYGRPGKLSHRLGARPGMHYAGNRQYVKSVLAERHGQTNA